MIELAVLTWLVNALWIVPLMAAAAAVCTRFGRLGPRGRHGAWLAALILAVGLPALPAAVAPMTRLSARPAPQPLPQNSARRAPASAIDIAATAAAKPAAEAAAPADPPPPLVLGPGWSRTALGLAGLAVAIALCRLLLAIRAGRALARAARSVDLDPGLVRELRDAASAHRRRLPPILESEAVGGPAVVGALHPTILIPPGFNHVSRDEQTAALLHELAHVVRNDYAWNLACEALSLPAAWHPAVLPIKAGVRRSRETACDALAAAAMASPTTYAKCLVSLAGRLGAVGASPAVLVGLIGQSDLEERLMTLIEPEPRGATAALRLGGAVAIAVLVLIPAVLLRVTPALAEGPAIAHRLLLPAGAGPPRAASETTPMTPVTPATPARPAVVAITASRASAAAPAPAWTVADIAPPAWPPEEPPPPPPPAPPAPIAAPAPPAPPAPPAALAGLTDEEGRALAAEGRYEAIVRRTVEQALRSETILQSEEMRRALAELNARQADLVRVESARIHQEMSQAVAELDRAHLGQTLDQLRAQSQSPQFREAIERAARDAARAAADAQAADHRRDEPER